MNFLSQKVDGKIIFTDYWKVLILNFSVMGNTVFFSVKKLMERWYLLGLFELPMIFEGLGNMAYCALLWIYTHNYSEFRAFGMLYPPTQKIDKIIKSYKEY